MLIPFLVFSKAHAIDDDVFDAIMQGREEQQKNGDEELYSKLRESSTNSLLISL